VPNAPSVAVTRKSSAVVASTIKWEIESNSVGNDRRAGAESAGQQGPVATPLNRGLRSTSRTHPSSASPIREFSPAQVVTVPRAADVPPSRATRAVARIVRR
jgi:hypothetical protein